MTIILDEAVYEGLYILRTVTDAEKWKRHKQL
jgi:hypothetical protein